MARGKAFELSFLQRGLLACRVPWFYFGKLVWPANLVFVYPRWIVSPDVWWQWLFPAATVATLLGMWMLRRRWRAPLAGTLLFVGTLLPVLGFLNVYPFQYSFVADHFQYLASLGVIVPVAAGATLLWQRFLPHSRRFGMVVSGVVVVALAALSARQCTMYRDAATLYETTIARNPDCWLAYLNLGAVRAETGRPQEAIELYQQALRIKPEDADVHANLGMVLVALGETESGLAQLKEAVRLAPRSSQTHYRYGIALLRTGQTDDAARQLAESARLFPDSSKIQNNLGVALFTAGRLPEAIAAFGRAIELDPQFSDAYENLLGTLAKSGPTPEATAAAAIALSSARVAKLESASQRLDDWLRQSQRPASTP